MSFAYTYESPVGAGCHERISSDAYREVRAELELPKVPPEDREVPLLNDLPFRLPKDMEDVAGAALLIGVRDNDLKGHSGIDAHGLAAIHGDPDGQREHCLRRPEQDGPDGNAEALADCRAYIRHAVLRAIDEGLGPDGRPDPTRRTTIDLHLEVNPMARARLPLFEVYMGQALHAVQDSFTHTFRSADGKKVRVVLNWVEFAETHLNERRDGPAHMPALDRCDDESELHANRRALATEASTKLLRAALKPGASAASKRAAVDAVLDEYLSYEPGCDYAERWCDAEELVHQSPASCSATSGAPLLIAAALGAAALRRRSKVAVIGSALAVLLGAANANAAEPPACIPGHQIACACSDGAPGAQRCEADGSRFAECHCEAQYPSPFARSRGQPVTFAVGKIPASPKLTEITTAETESKDTTVVLATPPLPIGVFVGGGLSIDRTAVATQVGARYSIDEYWSVGGSLEWNPWWSLETKRFRPGAMNGFGSIIRHYPINDWASARTTLHAGLSVLMFDLYGAPASSVGAFVGISFLGIQLKLSDGWSMIIDPCEVALPAPHLTGAPFVYRQYRFALGFQYGG